MASERGGYKRPTNPSSYSGVGKNSKRTDGRQAIKSPNVQDSTDLSVGDRERIIQGQKIAPLSETPSPRLAAPASGPTTPGGQGAVAELPQHLLAMPSTRPLEDEMTPASAPPMEPADDKEIVLQFLIDTFQDANASQMLEEIRVGKQVAAPAPMPPQLPPEVAAEPGEPEPLEFGEDLATEEEMAGEDEELSVETPATSSEVEVV